MSKNTSPLTVISQRRCSTASGGAKNTEPKESAPHCQPASNKSPKKQRPRKTTVLCESSGPEGAATTCSAAVIGSQPLWFRRPAQNPRDQKYPSHSAAV